jgi:hypothetical protein
MAVLNFSDALMEARRKAQLTGRPLSQQEVASAASGYAMTAAERAAQQKQLDIAQQQADTSKASQEVQAQAQAAQEEQFAQELAARNEQFAAQMGLSQSQFEESQNQFAANLALQTKNAETAASQFKTSYDLEMFKTQKQIEAADAAVRTQGRTAIASGVTTGALAGALYGAQAGSTVGPGYGTAIGAGVGLLAGLVASGGKCIIITACTDPHSYEVEISRAFRDTFMDQEELAGYYWLAPKIAPLILKYPWFKRFIKKNLVDRLVDYGEWALGLKIKEPKRLSNIVARSFLELCHTIGLFVGKENVHV